MLQRGHLGVHPSGALGVAFFMHAKAECFVGRGGAGITDTLKRTGAMTVQNGTTHRSINLRGRVFSNLLESDALDRLPELLLVCCNPDQLGLFTGEVRRYIENLAQRGRLRSVADIEQYVPILLILPNGILAEQTLHTYEEQLREAMLLGRLPNVSDEMIAALLDRVVRAVSLQAGGRSGSNERTVYLLEGKGKVVFAGGCEAARERVEDILRRHDYPATNVHGVPGTRIEFDKSMISIVLNVGGLIHMVKPDGELIDLRMGDLCNDPDRHSFVHDVTRAVFDVGRAVGAYPPDADYEAIWTAHRAIILSNAGHVTSSVKSFRDALADGLETVTLFPNEEWVLTPLARYAARAGLTRQEALFKSLRRQVQEAMARAIRFRDAGGIVGGGRRNMKLLAQRNFTLELYQIDADQLLLIGTLLDEEHLIKLELGVSVVDEQITSSTVNMIRTPFPVCREVESAAERLVGLRVEGGVTAEIARRCGGRDGCGHLKELAINVAEFASMHLARIRAGIDPSATDYATRPAQERFVLTREQLQDSCVAYCQTTPHGLDERIGIRRVGDEHTHPLPLGDYEPSLGVLLRDRAAPRGDRVYMRYRNGEEIVSTTWKQFADTVFQIARHLIGLGVRPGDRVMVLSENRPEMFLLDMAIMSIGAVSVPVFAGSSAAQVAYVLGHARPRFAAVSGKHQLEKIDRSRSDGVERWFSMDYEAACGAWGAVDFATLTADGGASPEQLDERIDAVRGDDLCMVMYTSGTTGPPKGVQLCHQNLISQQKAISLIWDITEADVLMAFLPWHHSFGGLFERFLTLYSGCRLCLDDSRARDMDRFIENFRAFGPTLFFSVPRVHELLVNRCLEDASVAEMVLNGRVRFGFSAGAPLPVRVAAFYREHNIPILEGWGLTETSPCVTLMTLEESWRSGYVGFPIPGVKVRVDSDQEILVKGPNVMLGYLDDEEATAHVIGNDGWFRSGDLGEFTRDGLRIFGRKDGAFKLTTGEKVHPQRIENVLINESPFISLALVVGSGKDYVGALLYPDAAKVRSWATEQGVTAENALQHPAFHALIRSEVERLNPMIEVKYQRVRRVTLADHEPCLDRGEVTPSGKIVRKRVIHACRAKVEALFAPQAGPDVIEIPHTHEERKAPRAER